MPSTCEVEDAPLVDELVFEGIGETFVDDYRESSGSFFDWLDSFEVPLVRGVVTVAAHPMLRGLTRAVTWLGNGWMYPVVALTLVFLDRALALRLLAAGGISAGICFSAYPLLKRRVARLRPFHVDPTIRPTSRPLDFYSCPSGHAMAATAVAVPLAVGVPHMLLAVLASWGLIAWSRVSSGHHFPSDVLFGAVVGSAVALPIALFLL